MPNLSRRRLIVRAATIAAAVPAAAIPLPAPALSAVLPTLAVASPSADIQRPPIAIEQTSPEQLAFAEQLKPLFRQYYELRPKHYAAYQAAFDVGGFSELGMNRTENQQKEADARFEKAAKENGYYRLCGPMGALADKMEKIARKNYRTKATNRMEYGIRAAAALTLSDDLDNSFEEPSPYETTQLLWEMAAGAGFPTPLWVTKKLKRMAAVHARKAVQS